MLLIKPNYALFYSSMKICFHSAIYHCTQSICIENFIQPILCVEAAVAVVVGVFELPYVPQDDLRSVDAVRRRRTS